jgi:hypothetical protein
MKSASIDQAHDTLSTLAALDRGTLAEQWSIVFGCPAPRNCQATFLRCALAWHYQMTNQAKAGSGGIKRIRKKLQHSATSAPIDSLAPGTRLLREWQGQTHHVTVLSHGFEYAGTTYRSLTAIARLITGTPWSGPQFFGLRS